MSTSILERSFASTRSVLVNVTPADFELPTLDRMITLPFGTLPASVFIGIASTDAYSHGWDLARATGQSTDLDSELAAELLDRARASLPDTFRGPDGTAPFGPEVEAPASATAADHLAAFLGRAL